jgi:hypothetical protein
MQVLHDDVGSAVWQLPMVKDLHDSRVFDDIYGAGFVDKALVKVRGLAVCLAKDFDGDAALNGSVSSFKNIPHPASADLADDYIRTYLLWGLHLISRTTHYTTEGGASSIAPLYS